MRQEKKMRLQDSPELSGKRNEQRITCYMCILLLTENKQNNKKNCEQCNYYDVPMLSFLSKKAYCEHKPFKNFRCGSLSFGKCVSLDA